MSRLFIVLLFLLALPAFAEAPSDLDLRIGALQQELNAHVTLLSGRAASLAAELASVQAKLKVANDEVERLKKDSQAQGELK